MASTNAATDFGLRGRTLCVTGGASGIGRAAAQMAAMQGAAIGLIDFNADAAKVAAAELRLLGVNVWEQVLDIRDSAAVDAAVRDIEGQLGPIDALLACAGSSGAGRAHQISSQEWGDVLAVNATGTFNTCQAVGRRMIERRGGAISVIGSLDGVGGHPGRTHYVAAKFALTGMVKNLALEWGRWGIRVNCIAPSFVDTPLMRAGVPPEYLRDVVIDRTPLGRVATADEVAWAALVLLSDGASFISGQVLAVDGGMSAGWLTARSGDDLSSNRLRAAGVYPDPNPIDS